MADLNSSRGARVHTLSVGQQTAQLTQRPQDADAASRCRQMWPSVATAERLPRQQGSQRAAGGCFALAVSGRGCRRASTRPGRLIGHPGEPLCTQFSGAVSVSRK